MSCPSGVYCNTLWSEADAAWRAVKAMTELNNAGFRFSFIFLDVLVGLFGRKITLRDTLKRLKMHQNI